MIANKLFLVYNKSKVAMRQRKSKKSNFIIGIWEVNNKKKSKNLIIDTLSEENLKETIKNIGGLVDGGKEDEKDDNEEEEKDDKEKNDKEINDKEKGENENENNKKESEK